MAFVFLKHVVRPACVCVCAQEITRCTLCTQVNLQRQTPVSLNPGQSGEREWRERSRVSSIKITMLFNSGLIKSAFSPPSEAQDQTAAGDSQPHKSLSSSGFVFNHCFFTLRQRAFYSKLMLVYTAGLLK